MTSAMKSTINRLRRENRIVAEPEEYDGGSAYTVWVTRRGHVWIADIWDDGAISYAERIS
jgi:hypothetical protein